VKRVHDAVAAEKLRSQNPYLPVSIETIGFETSFETTPPRSSKAEAGCGMSSPIVSKTLVFETTFHMRPNAGFPPEMYLDAYHSNRADSLLLTG